MCWEGRDHQYRHIHTAVWETHVPRRDMAQPIAAKQYPEKLDTVEQNIGGINEQIRPKRTEKRHTLHVSLQGGPM